MLNNWVNTYYTNYEMGKQYSKKQVGEKYIKIKSNKCPENKILNLYLYIKYHFTMLEIKEIKNNNQV